LYVLAQAAPIPGRREGLSDRRASPARRRKWGTEPQRRGLKKINAPGRAATLPTIAANRVLLDANPAGQRA